MNRVLVVRLDEIGDVVMTSPLLRELRRELPHSWITLVVNPAVSQLVQLCPYVNEVLTYDGRAPGFVRPLARHLRALKLAWVHLRPRRFDLAILPRWDTDIYHGTFLLYLSGARMRLAFSEDVNGTKKRHNAGFDRMLTHALRDGSSKHEVEHNLDVIRFLGGSVDDDRLELWVSEEDEKFADDFLKGHGLEPDDPVIGIGLGAGARKRQWPIDRYADLCLWLHQQHRARALVIGGQAEHEAGSEFRRSTGAAAINAAGRATLRQTTALLKRTCLYVGNDSGPMHIAAAVGVPVVELSCHPEQGSPSSPNAPTRFGPWRVGGTVVQPESFLDPCADECSANSPHCILGITVDRARRAVAPFLRQRDTVRLRPTPDCSWSTGSSG